MLSPCHFQMIISSMQPQRDSDPDDDDYENDLEVDEDDESWVMK